MSDHDLRVVFLVVACILFAAEYVLPYSLVPAGLVAFAASFLVPLV